MDSPGWSAQYCTYSLADNESKKIVHLENIDKRECDRKSTVMEKEALKRGLNCLLDQGMKIEELTTDAHIAISAMLRTGELICLVTKKCICLSLGQGEQYEISI